jgi:P pilus assembly chaperone PapD
MMILRNLYALAFIMFLTLFVFMPEQAGALSLQVQPLSYQESLGKGEKKKGFIDITNPTSETITLQTSVEAFRQTDNNGSLRFYKDEQIEAGIIPDFSEFTLKGGQTMRLMFLVDGTKLPEGDIFAGLMATNLPDQKGNMAQAVRVGTLLILTNGTPGARQAEVTSLDTSVFQLGGSVSGSYTVRNTAPSSTSSGFYPEVSISLWPFGATKKQQSSLVFAGRERSNQFELPTKQIGIYKITVGYGASQKSNWIVVASPVWIGGIILLAVALAVVVNIRRQRRQPVTFKKHAS